MCQLHLTPRNFCLGDCGFSKPWFILRICCFFRFCCFYTLLCFRLIFVCLRVRVGSRIIVSGCVDVCVFVVSGVQNSCGVQIGFYYFCGRCLNSSLCAPTQAHVVCLCSGLFLVMVLKRHCRFQDCRFLVSDIAFRVGVVACHACLHCCRIVLSYRVFVIPCLGVLIGLLILYGFFDCVYFGLGVISVFSSDCIGIDFNLDPFYLPSRFKFDIVSFFVC